jgi:hypothetical protein
MMKYKTLFLLIVSIFGIYFSWDANAQTIRVMVIDTGVDLSHPEIKSHVKEDFNFNYLPYHWHGTAMAGIILKDTCKEVELISCDYHAYSKTQQKDSNECFRRASRENIQFVNYSSYGERADHDEKMAIKKLTDNGTIVVVAAGNNGKNLMATGKCRGSYPACYLFKNLYSVQNLNQDGTRFYASNYLKNVRAKAEIGVDVACLMPNNETGVVTGTSPAAAKFTNRLLLKACKNLHK